MSLGIVLDVVIGLVFTYLLLAIMVSGVLEMIAGGLSLRGKKLRSGMALLLTGLTKSGQPHGALFDSVFGHSLVSQLAKAGLPSYVPSRNFSIALFDTLKDGSSGPLFSRIEQGIALLPNGPAKQSLSAFATQAAGDVDVLQKRVEIWFDDAMDRVSGEYKRLSQVFVLVAGFAVAVAVNVDSIALARALWTQPALRAAYVDAAQKHMDRQSDGSGQAKDVKEASRAARCELAALPLPIGWSEPKAADGCPSLEGAINLRGAAQRLADIRSKDDLSGVWIVVGWIITALAVSFGAPFWFAALQQLLKLRNTGPKPPRSEEADQGASR